MGYLLVDPLRLFVYPIILILGGIATALEMDSGLSGGWPWRPSHRWAGRPTFGECLGWLHRRQSWV